VIDLVRAPRFFVMVVICCVAAVATAATVAAQPAGEAPRFPALAHVMDAARLAGAPSQWPVPARFDRLELVQLSGTHSIVAGGHALVGVGLPSGIAPGSVRVSLNGHDVTSEFSTSSHLDPDFAGLVGLVTGLRQGTNELSAHTARSGQPAGPGRQIGSDDRMTLYDYPASGPIFSGPQVQPWYCTTSSFGLGAAADAVCDAPTQTSYEYMSSTGSFKVLSDFNQMPPDVVSTTTSDGRTVPYIVRVETGTLDRGIYRIWLLDNPFQSGPPGTRGWNRKLVYTFGGLCNPGPDQGTVLAGGATGMTLGNSAGETDALGKGYAVAASTLNVYQNTCNEVLSAEALLMVKQHFAQTYGVPDWTVGVGGSGGSVQQLQIAQNYPGLLNAIIPNRTFPDAATLEPVILDCNVFQHYFSGAGATWTASQQAAAEGFVSAGTCGAWASFLPALQPSVCPAPVPPAAVYNPVTNPSGVRCDMFDSAANIYGRDPVTGFGYRYYGNTGVQYGLQALLQSKISGDQFLDLNRQAGGLDVDGNHVAARTQIDAPAVRAAYATGRVNEGVGGMPDVPILDIRPWDDSNAADPHTSGWEPILRLRLDQGAHGHALNYLYWVSAPQNSPATLQPTLGVEDTGLAMMGRWLDAIAADTSARPLSAKVASDRPADATDACFTADGARHDGTVSAGGTNFCSTTYPVSSSPRQIAGAPPADNVMECRLEPVSPASYNGKLTTGQLGELRQIFPGGVCDYSKPSQDARPFRGTWLSFGG
jgi:hypothetical protein